MHNKDFNYCQVVINYNYVIIFMNATCLFQILSILNYVDLTLSKWAFLVMLCLHLSVCFSKVN